MGTLDTLETGIDFMRTLISIGIIGIILLIGINSVLAHFCDVQGEGLPNKNKYQVKEKNVWFFDVLRQEYLAFRKEDPKKKDKAGRWKKVEGKEVYYENIRDPSHRWYLKPYTFSETQGTTFTKKHDSEGTVYYENEKLPDYKLFLDKSCGLLKIEGPNSNFKVESEILQTRFIVTKNVEYGINDELKIVGKDIITNEKVANRRGLKRKEKDGKQHNNFPRNNINHNRY